MAQQQKDDSADRRSGPTEKMLAAATRAADRHGVKLPEAALTDFEVCRKFLDEYLNKPTEKAIAFAHKLAKDGGTKVPPEVLGNSRELSAWIDAHKTA
jgi:DNA topoisomerase-3